MNKGINSNKNSLSKEKNEKNRYPQTSSNNFQKKIIIKDLNLKTTVSSGPNKSKDINSDSYTKTDNNKSYNVNDLFPKLPLRDSIDKVNNLLLNNESELKILDLKKELNQRGLLIFEALLDVLEFSKLDPILEVFKSNQESLNNEREQFLDNILIQNKKLTKIYNQLEEKNIKEISDFEEKLNNKTLIIKRLEEDNLKKETQIKNIENSLRESEEKLKDILNKNELLLIDEEKKNTYIDNLRNEIITFKQKVNFLENNPKEKLIENDFNLIQTELSDRNNIITSMQTKINSLIEDNENLKHEINKKDFVVEELISKIEALRLEFDNKIEEKKTEIDQLTRMNQSLNEKINKEYKDKIHALKIKLREKVNALLSLEKQFEKYKLEKENSLLRYLQSNQKIITDKNQIITELIRTKSD